MFFLLLLYLFMSFLSGYWQLQHQCAPLTIKKLKHFVAFSHFLLAVFLFVLFSL